MGEKTCTTCGYVEQGSLSEICQKCEDFYEWIAATHPTPTEANVRKALELAHKQVPHPRLTEVTEEQVVALKYADQVLQDNWCYYTASILRNAFAADLAALDEAQEKVADLRPEYHYAELSDTKWAKAISLLRNYIREHAHNPHRKALLEAVDALLETAEKNAQHNTRLLVCFDRMRKQKLALHTKNARLVKELAALKGDK